jgi:hypothetical protein
LVEICQNNPEAAADVTQNQTHHDEEDKSLEASIELQELVDVLDQHLPLLDYFQDSH